MLGFKLVRFDDWEALYRTDTGEKVHEEHRIAPDLLLKLINADCDVAWAPEEIEAAAMESGVVPERLSDYPEGSLD